ncbi:FG-GAP-like repeat-containing protein [Methylomonas sp. AM2-LC]|uniref:FG-GAP-like repeat-containing protein n=1 Tax=Methylomonas sp. AM2-LC TaxID=3153301 RepID=UPI00326506A8
MLQKLLSTPHLKLIAAICLLLLGLIVFATPFKIPGGFPFAAKAIPSSELPKNQALLPVTFIDKTLEKGLNFIQQQGDEVLAGIDESLGSGACAADFNQDGWVDLFLVNGSGHTRYYGRPYWWQKPQGNALYLNQGGVKFIDATAASGLEKMIWGMGCLAADFDNDGDSDLLVTGKEARLLYKNNGDGTFTDVSADSGMMGQSWSTSAAAVDFNQDGLLDIYLGNFIDFKKGKKTFEANSQFATTKNRTFDASLYEAQANQLYLNTGSFKFKEMALAAGVADADGRTLDVSWQDINNDGLPDILVSNDKGTGSNTAFLNIDGQHFEPVSEALGLRSALGNRGIASGDLNNDGEIDFIFGSSMGETTIALIKAKTATGKFQYKDLARDFGIGANQFLNLSSWSPIIQDFNNDGFNDVFIAGGLVEPDADASKVSQGQHKQLLLSNAQHFFTDVSDVSGIALQDNQSARGVAAADFDNDGDIDLYVVHNNDLGQFLQNDAPPQHWLGLKLIGQQSNQDAIGAQIELTYAGGRQTKTVVSGEGFLSDSDKRVVFGLAANNQIDHVNIHWPSGKQQTLTGLSVDQYWQIKENNPAAQALPIIAAAPVTQELKLKQGVKVPEVRVSYIQLLSQSDFTDQTWQELKIANLDADAQVRLAVVNAVSKVNTVPGLNILIQALEDPQASNVVAAISGLRIYEDETSVRWLLRKFSHPDASVRIALADCFAYFFQEEEAVVHRKYLAVPYLIRLLDDPEPQVRVAASRALANAERFRGVHTLLSHLQDAEPTARAEIVRTLGLIRQGQALPKLTALLQDPAQPDSVLANVFIALKRLGDTESLHTLDAYVMAQAPFSAIPLEKRLGVFAALMSQDQEVLVFDPLQVNTMAEVAFKAFSNRSEPTAFTLHWLTILRHSNTKAISDWLENQSRSSDANIRLLAFQTLLTQKNLDRDVLLRRAWADHEVPIQIWALNGLLQNKALFVNDDYRKILAAPALRDVALKCWLDQGISGDVDALKAVLLADKSTNKVKSAHTVVEQSEPETDKLSTIEASSIGQVCFNKNTDVQAFCPLILFDKNDANSRQIAVKLLRDESYPLALREAVLKAYNGKFDPEAINVLYSLVQNKNEPLRRVMLQKLFALDSDALVGFAEKFAKNDAEDAWLRFEAIVFLIHKGHLEDQEILYR